jgi:serine O-acetyltransferase
MKQISKQLMESYRKDSEPFITKTELLFPERENVFRELKLLRELFFPNYWNSGLITKNKYELEKKLKELKKIIFSGVYSFLLEKEKSDKISDFVLEELLEIREKLKKDIEAAFKGDPAAKNYAEIIRTYPGFTAILIQRVANIIYSLGATSYARELTEQVHSFTGIDIHPGAKIGEYFFIDHGTGVVVGETSEIGNNVRLYQSVTLGALHFAKEKGGILKKDYKRHPTLGDNVVIGAGAKILGPVKIGSNVNIGANSWIEEDVSDYTTVLISEHPKLIKKKKEKKE